MPKVAIVQSNYLPWKGYFDLINSVDDFIFYDEVQYTRRDWRNRNLIKTGQGLRWLTVPVQQFSYTQRINETHATDNRWARRHWRTVAQAYARAPYFPQYCAALEHLYQESGAELLSHINQRFIHAVNNWLGITTRLHESAALKKPGAERTARLIELVQAVGGTEYVSGPAAKAYLDANQFARAGIGLTWMSYDGYPEYRQQHGAFEHHVSVLDLLLNEGPAATHYMLSFAHRPPNSC